MTKAEVLSESLSDMLGVEQLALERIDRQIRDERVKKFFNASESLRKINAVLKTHTKEIEKHLIGLNAGVETRLKKAATSFAGSFADLYSKLRTKEPVSRILRDDYTLLNLAVITYGMLETAALALSETEISSMAQRHMRDLTPFIVELSDIIPHVLAGELAEKGKIEDVAVAQQAVAQYRQAWSREVTMRS